MQDAASESGRLRWRRMPRQTGLSAIGAPERGYELHDGTQWFAHIYPNGGGWRSEQRGWYWVARVGDELINTHGDPVELVSEAKTAASAWVRARIGRDADAADQDVA